jgi:trimethylamine--corrinoid protein Co-methyltransferase
VRHPAQLTVLDDEAFHRLHEAVLDVLESVGVEMKHEGGRTLCADAGAAVSGTRVRPSPELVERTLETAPQSWPLTQRAEARTALTLSPEHSWFGTGPDCPYVRDPYSGARRRARLADVRSYAALTEKLPTIDFHMSMGLPEDVAPERVDIVQFAAMLASTGKPLVASSPFGGETLRVMHDMASACGGPDSFACLAMSSPPLMLDEVAVDKILTCAELHVPLVLAPSPSAGTTAPASLAAVLVLALAEVTAGLVVHQLAAPGAPFVFGSGCGVTNMRTSVEAYLPPGVALGNHVAAEMATRYGSSTASRRCWGSSRGRRSSTTWAIWRAACRARMRRSCWATISAALRVRSPPACCSTTRLWRSTRSRRWGPAARTWRAR